MQWWLSGIKRLVVCRYVGQLPLTQTLPRLTHSFTHTQNQISHETVNLMSCSIVWNGIMARHPNPEPVRGKYWHHADRCSHNISGWLFSDGTNLLCFYLPKQRLILKGLNLKIKLCIFFNLLWCKLNLSKGKWLAPFFPTTTVIQNLFPLVFC